MNCGLFSEITRTEEIKTMENVLYGGYEGSDAEICENCESLGELLVKKLRLAGKDTVLVRQLSIQRTFFIIIQKTNEKSGAKK